MYRNIIAIAEAPIVMVAQLGNCEVKVISIGRMQELLKEVKLAHLDPHSVMFYTGPVEYPLTATVTSITFRRLKEEIEHGKKEIKLTEEDFCIRV